jgi:hypothetical protein
MCLPSKVLLSLNICRTIVLSCWTGYVEVARVTCEMVCTLQDLPVVKGRRLTIYLQDEALAAHVQATRALLTALGVHPPPEPVPSDSFPELTISTGDANSSPDFEIGRRPHPVT